jgi:hypothetical protein
VGTQQTVTTKNFSNAPQQKLISRQRAGHCRVVEYALQKLIVQRAADWVHSGQVARFPRPWALPARA